ncbi:MAG: DUF4280 domain-containing protein [Firmicutes bacterium]|nr:DUF4280 domain-containing protein [Bacillota bacterium]
MPNPVINSSHIKCSSSCGLPPGVPIPKAPSYPPGIPGQLLVSPANKVFSNNQCVANISDNKIVPFQLSCQSQVNPTVQSASIAATAAALGAAMFVPAPCTPVIAGPWSPGSPKCLINNKPILDNTCKLICSMGGTIEIINTLAVTVKV